MPCLPPAIFGSRCLRSVTLGGACFVVVLCLLLVQAFLPPANAAPPEPQPKPQASAAGADRVIRLGILAFRPKPVMEERFGALGTYLSSVMEGHQVQIVPLTEPEIERGLGAGQIDFILTSPTHYVALREFDQLSGVLATLVPREGDAPLHGIGGVIMRRADRADINQLEDLRGLRIAIAGKTFLGTYMAPAAEMVRAGVPLTEVTFIETGHPTDQVVQLVLEGRADVGFARTGLLEEMEREGRLQPGQISVINPQGAPGFPHLLSTRLYPEWPLVAAAHVSPALSHQFAGILLDLPASHPAIRQARIYGFTIPGDYSAVERAMRDVRMVPFDQVEPLAWADVWQQYQSWLLALAVSGALLLLTALALAVNTRRLAVLSRDLAADRAQLQARQAELDHMAHYDPLTGLPNRHLLEARMHQACTLARRSGQTLAVCYLDLDDFKPVNDRLGHVLGDRLLVEVARRLRQCLRAEDTLARLGGDEFVLLLADLPDAGAWWMVLRQMMDQVRQPVHMDEHIAFVSASAGVTLFPADDAAPDALLRHADQAMYRAKQSGRNCYHMFDMVQDREMLERHEQLLRLGLALQQGEFVLYYQPQVDLRDGRLLGFEALIRWQHPERGLLGPAVFLPVLADTELEIKLGQWVIEEALRQRSAWGTAQSGIAPQACVSVNIEGRQLLRPGFVAWLRGVLQHYPKGMAECLELEVLESAALADMPTAVRVMTECRAMGVRFALDDFGTGYSSLAYFRSLPLDKIKIDKSFVINMLDQVNDRRIVESIAYLAHAFECPVLAEGVEAWAHAAALRGLNCHYAQGYGVGRPMPAQEVEAWLARWHKEQPWRQIATAPQGR